MLVDSLATNSISSSSVELCSDFLLGRGGCIIHPSTMNGLLEKNIFIGKKLENHQLSHEKNPYYFPFYWLVNKDPYSGLLKSLYNWVV